MNIVSPHPRRTVLLAAGVSLLTLLAGAWLVLCWWYPPAFWQASGILGIAAYAASAHLVITALFFLPWRNCWKNAASVQSDVAFLMFVMLGVALFSLSYLFAGRPVALVFSVDRVVLVRANEIRATELAFAGILSKGLRISAPLQLIAARRSTDEERLDSIQLAMAGFDLHQRPSFWIDIAVQRDQISQKARNIDELRGVFARQLAEFGNPKAEERTFLPLAGANGEWVLVLDNQLKTFVPLKIK